MLIKIHVCHSFFSPFTPFILSSCFSMSVGNLQLPAAALIWMMKLYSFVWISVYIIHFLGAVPSLYCLKDVKHLIGSNDLLQNVSEFFFVRVFNSPL